MKKKIIIVVLLLFIVCSIFLFASNNPRIMRIKGCWQGIDDDLGTLCIVSPKKLKFNSKKENYKIMSVKEWEAEFDYVLAVNNRFFVLHYINDNESFIFEVKEPTEFNGPGAGYDMISTYKAIKKS